MHKYFPLIIAHSGCMNQPENTLASAEAGLKLGADIVEDDIRMTRDGILVLAHEDVVHLPNGTVHSISQNTYSALSQLDICSNEGNKAEMFRLVTLEALLLLMKRTTKIVNLDLKVDECIKPVSDLVQKHDMLEQVIISGCESERAQKVKLANPRLRRLLNADYRLFLTLDYKEAAAITCNDALNADCFGINIDYQMVSSELVETAKNKGLPILVWTVNDENQMRRMVEMGVYSITTRNVEALVDLKQRWI